MTQTNETYLVSTKNFRGSCYSNLIDGVSPYSGRTRAEIEAQYPDEKFIEVDWDGFEKMLKDYEKNLITGWTEITEERYWEMLEILPPMNWRNLTAGINIFCISEALTGSLHAHFLKLSNKGEVKYYEATKDRFTKNEDLLKEIYTEITHKNLKNED